MAPPRKPDNQRIRRNKVVTETLTGTGEVPALPVWASANVWSVEWWEAAWSSPVAAKWEACDIPALARLALLHGEVASGHLDDSKLLSEIRALEDRFLLNPNARRLAGVVLDDSQPQAPKKSAPKSAERAQRLKVV